MNSGPQLSALACYERSRYDALIDILMSGVYNDYFPGLYNTFYVSSITPTDMTLPLGERVQAYSDVTRIEDLPAPCTLDKISSVIYN